MNLRWDSLSARMATGPQAARASAVDIAKPMPPCPQLHALRRQEELRAVFSSEGEGGTPKARPHTTGR